MGSLSTMFVLVEDVNFTSVGNAFQILGPTHRIDCAHFEVDECAMAIFDPLRVLVWEDRN